MDIEARAGEFAALIMRDYPPGDPGTEEAVARTAGAILVSAYHFANSLGIDTDRPTIIAELTKAANDAMIAKVEEMGLLD